MNGHDLIFAHALFDEAPADRFGVCDDGVGELICAALDEFLRPRANPRSLAARSDARRRSGQPGADHPEDVRVKVVRVDDIYPPLSQKTGEAGELLDHASVIKTGDRKRRNFAEPHLTQLAGQISLWAHTRDEYLKARAFFQRLRDLRRLTLRSRRIKAIY